MPLCSTYVLLYALSSFQRCHPCIFLTCVVTITSMQSRLRDVSDFRDSNFTKSVTAVILLLCILVPTERYMLILVMFSKDVLQIQLLSIYPCLFCNYGVTQHVLILLYFCYKMFLADCLRVIQFCQASCSCFIHAMYLLLPWIAS